MNKKFTFMVAALLAAGSFGFANATDLTGKGFADLKSGQYYYIIGDQTTGTEITSTSTADQYLGVQASGAFSFENAIAEDVPSNAKNKLGYMWQVKITKEGEKKYVEFYNPLIDQKLSVSPSTGTFVATIAGYEEAGLISKFEIDETNNDAKILGKEINIASSSITLAETFVAHLLFYEVAPESQTPASLQDKLGAGFSLDFEGTPTGEDIFNKLTVVTFSGSAASGEALNGATAPVGGQFLLQVGESRTLTYNLSNATELAAFKAAEFIVLTGNKNVTRTDDDYKEGYGFSYAKVKGSDLVHATTANTEVKSGKYPVENAIFTAVLDVNDDTKLSITHHTSVMVPVVKATDEKNYWTTATGSVQLGIGGTTTSKVVSSSDDIAWLTVGKGTAVAVKDLVKGRMLVHVLTTSGTGSSSFDYLLFDKLTVNSEDNQVVFTTTVADTELQKSNLASQWYVSANKDNTITLINRESGITVDNVNLYTTPATGVYLTKASTTANKPEAMVNGKYIKFVNVENVTNNDGYLNLSDEELKEEYVLNTVSKINGFDLDAVLSQGSITSQIIPVTDATKALNWKLSQTTREKENEDGETVNVVDTVYQITNYKYYAGDALKTATDTLKVFKYDLKATNATAASATDLDNILTSGYSLDGQTGTSAQSVIFRKSGEKYTMSYAPASAESLRTQLVTASEYASVNASGVLAVGSTIGDALSFELTPVNAAPSYAVPEAHFALEIGGAYLGANANETGVLTNDTTMLKSTDVDSSFSFYAFSADKEEAKTPSYYLSTNGKMMYNPADTIAKYNEAIQACSSVFEAEKKAALLKEKAKYVNGDAETSSEALVKFQPAKYVNADSLYIVEKGINGDALKSFKFNIFDVDGSAVLKNAKGQYVSVVNGIAILRSDVKDAAKFNVVAAEAPTSNESVSASEVSVVAQNGSVVVKNAAGKNVVVSTILGQVVANEVLTSDNATINVPAGIVVVAVEGESFKVNVK